MSFPVYNPVPLFRPDSYYVRRWGCTLEQVGLLHGKSIRPEELDRIAFYLRDVASIGYRRNRRKLNRLLFYLGPLAKLPSYFAKRLALLCLLAVVKLAALVTGVLAEAFTERDDSEILLLEQPLSRIPNVKSNAPNALV